ncbi:homocysteine S-methyltransferase [Paenibacillus bovis]|uniref:S-methylmethionine:homocysteine methyltransferase n=1 Tax=Paenibacillus bovis TaxID=1616788 RepID=A0A172ZFR0_9BACL|nr:homocysteine S-methyltransferase [Paenibacillus bovis]ANF96107.1 homocysteine S-methyltransferase [Paenibacillus bovis]
MNLIQSILEQYGVMILDGAMATELERSGADLNDSLWSARLLTEDPEAIRQVHYRYFEAGADCAITASYQATIPGFVQRGWTEQEAKELIRRSVQIAVEARDAFWTDYTASESNYSAGQVVLNQPDNVPVQTFPRPRPLVVASVGPYGAYLADGSEYRGDYQLNEQQLVEFHAPRIRELIEAGADLLACETIPCLIEAKAIVTVLQQFPGVQAWFSFSARDSEHISSGERAADCAAWLDPYEQVAAVGINCTALEYIPALISAMHAQTTKPILVYPNSGEQYDPVTKTWHGAACTQNYGQQAHDWYERGARLIGGCCRTTPADIASVRQALGNKMIK